MPWVFLSTPSARRATTAQLLFGAEDGISIHALREEGDLLLDADADTFYIFLSTPSARRATEEVRLTEYDTGISIHALREEGDLWDRLRQLRITISIHALREEGDAAPDGVFLFLSHFYPRPPRGGRHIVEINEHIRKLFLSTPSARRATCALQGLCQNHREISIHALREEGDC